MIDLGKILLRRQKETNRKLRKRKVQGIDMAQRLIDTRTEPKPKSKKRKRSR